MYCGRQAPQCTSTLFPLYTLLLCICVHPLCSMCCCMVHDVNVGNKICTAEVAVPKNCSRASPDCQTVSLLRMDELRSRVCPLPGSKAPSTSRCRRQGITPMACLLWAHQLPLTPGLCTCKADSCQASKRPLGGTAPRACYACFRAYTTYIGSPRCPNMLGAGVMSLASGGVQPPGTE